MSSGEVAEEKVHENKMGAKKRVQQIGINAPRVRSLLCFMLSAENNVRPFSPTKTNFVA